MSRHHRRRRRQDSSVNLGFQIAPMIDVVFVILLFFIVQAGDIQVEMSHITKLPGTEVTETSTDMPDEISVMIEDNGQVYLNDDPKDSPETKDLQELLSNLVALKESADATKSQVLVTIYADSLSKYTRVVDVLDALSRAQISNVTFQAGSYE